jgi:hypothetical protein
LIERHSIRVSGIERKGKQGKEMAGKISQLFLVRKFICIKFVVPKVKRVLKEI